MLHPQLTINAKGRLLSFETPRIMAILNVTPDSFYPGSRIGSPGEAVDRAGAMLEAGADVLDVGGMSSRPGAELIPGPEEMERVLPVISALHRAFPEALLSVDTVRADVARAAVEAGAAMINDISAGSIDPAMFETVAALQVPYVLMHMKGRPDNMRSHAEYENVTLEVLDFLALKLSGLRALGVKDVIVDPGFGFGKTIDHNYRLLKELAAFKIMDAPLLVGLSRKSMVYRVTGGEPADALPGASALHLVALQRGAGMIRTHDVAETAGIIKIFNRMKNA
jgi:dihydropteroate synthase